MRKSPVMPKDHDAYGAHLGGAIDLVGRCFGVLGIDGGDPLEAVGRLAGYVGDPVVIGAGQGRAQGWVVGDGVGEEHGRVVDLNVDVFPIQLLQTYGGGAELGALHSVVLPSLGHELGVGGPPGDAVFAEGGAGGLVGAGANGEQAAVDDPGEGAGVVGFNHVGPTMQGLGIPVGLLVRCFRLHHVAVGVPRFEHGSPPRLAGW